MLVSGAFAKLPPKGNVLEDRVELQGAVEIFRKLPVLFTLLVFREDGEPENMVVEYAGAGFSRVVYVSSDRQGLAFKIQSLEYTRDDNAKEYKLYQEVMQEWMVPKVFGYFMMEIKDIRVSVLAVAKMSVSIHDIVKERKYCPNQLRILVNAVVATWRLLICIIMETEVSLGDWQHGKVMLPLDDI